MTLLISAHRHSYITKLTSVTLNETNGYHNGKLANFKLNQLFPMLNLVGNTRYIPVYMGKSMIMYFIQTRQQPIPDVIHLFYKLCLHSCLQAHFDDFQELWHRFCIVTSKTCRYLGKASIYICKSVVQKC